MIYGATGTFQLNEIADQILSDGANPIIVVFGLVFVVCGLAFKLGAVPFICGFLIFIRVLHCRQLY